MHVGGITGFLYSLGYAIKTLNVTRCVIVFDGKGGSKKRRSIYPEYKANRTTKIRLNRMYEDLSTPDLEQDSVKHQLIKLIAYLDCLPVTVISIDHIEADDTIGYLATEYFTDKNGTVSIMSTDKDFIQLVDQRVQVWSPTKKKLYGPQEVLNEYGISCRNFLYYRIMTGDERDNINGIDGAGPKTTPKCFPMLAEEAPTSMDELMKYAESNINKWKLYETVVNNKSLMDRNHKLMQLSAVDIAGSTKMRIMDIMKKSVPELNKMRFTQLLAEDKMTSAISNHLVWLGESFGVLDSFVKNRK